MSVGTVLAWLGPIGRATSGAGRWLRTRIRGREKDWIIGALVAIILLVLWFASVSRRESSFYRAVNRGLELSLSGTGQNERVLLARIRDKDRTIDELRRTDRASSCEGDWTLERMPDGTTRERCLGTSSLKQIEDLKQLVTMLEAAGRPLPFVQPPSVPLAPPPSLAPVTLSRWSAGAGAGAIREADAWAIREADAWAWTGWGRASYRIAGPWSVDVIITAPVFGALAGVSIAP